MLRFDEGRGFCEVIDDKGGLCVAIIHGCERRKTLLACSVPYFELDSTIGELTLLSEECRCKRKRLVLTKFGNIMRIKSNGWGEHRGGDNRTRRGRKSNMYTDLLSSALYFPESRCSRNGGRGRTVENQSFGSGASGS